MQRLRIGVIGCGEIAQIMHLPFLTELRDLFEVRAVCDISARLVETAGDVFMCHTAAPIMPSCWQRAS